MRKSDAFATQGCLSEELFVELARQAIDESKEGDAQQFANTAYAFATFGQLSPSLPRTKFLQNPSVIVRASVRDNIMIAKLGFSDQ